MEIANLSHSNDNINHSMRKLKREWNATKGSWTDIKSAEYEKTFLVPVVMNQKKITNEMEALLKIAKRLASLGVDI